jgi:hypothetical protein
VIRVCRASFVERVIFKDFHSAEIMSYSAEIMSYSAEIMSYSAEIMSYSAEVFHNISSRKNLSASDTSVSVTVMLSLISLHLEVR